MSEILSNDNYDESIDIPDTEDITTPRVSSILSSHSNLLSKDCLPRRDNILEDEEDDSDSDTTKFEDMYLRPQKPLPPGSQAKKLKSSVVNDDDDAEGDDAEVDDDEESSEDASKIIEGAYNPSDYNHLNVSREIKNLFELINRYTPSTIELETNLKPFIPEYIPAVGDIDAFLKVPRVDRKPDGLGLFVLDEPCTNQSDPSVLDLQLRAVLKQSSSKETVVKSVHDVEENSHEIDQWVENISKLHRTQHAPIVHYNKQMPKIDKLMEVWPKELQELLNNTTLPTSELSSDLNTYIDIICAIVGIPVYQDRIQSLHVLFTLYMTFKNSQHFGNGT